MLIDNRVDLASAIGTDGVHLDGETDIAAARSELGDDALIGASAGMSRHVAITAGDAGADPTSCKLSKTERAASERSIWTAGEALIVCRTGSGWKGLTSADGFCPARVFAGW
ncbi:MAG: thiamine phosphate synthase, partial [Hyphomicrobiales bacterium]